ncbi:MAG: hypothetical protein R6W90_18420 [Ignavibacteriaceae bacterium]
MAINCRKCKYFIITWDSKRPYGCIAFGMKTRQMPSIEVYKSSGRECLKFEAKPPAKKKN